MSRCALKRYVETWVFLLWALLGCRYTGGRSWITTHTHVLMCSTREPYPEDSLPLSAVSGDRRQARSPHTPVSPNPFARGGA